MSKQYPYRRHVDSLQQEILDTLDEARCCGITFFGGGNGLVRSGHGSDTDKLFEAAGWECAGNASWQLPDGVYDMRETLRFIARRRDRIDQDGQVDKSFSVRFTHAVRALCDQGELVCSAPDLPNRAQRRFVRRADQSHKWPGYDLANPTQREIMDTLDAAKAAELAYLGYAHGIAICSKRRTYWTAYEAAGWERIDYIHWRVPDEVYDLRASLRYIAARRGRIDGSGIVDPSLATEFYRATRLLCDWGALICTAPNLPNLTHRRWVRQALAGTSLGVTPVLG